MLKIAVMSGKGGVGKSSISVLTALYLSKKGKTLVLDFDICGPSIGKALGAAGKVFKGDEGLIPVEVGENLFVLSMSSLIKDTDSIIWRGPKKISVLEMFIQSAASFEYCVMDTPPGLAEEHWFLINKNVKALIVSTPQNIALSDTSNTLEFCCNNEIEILGILENMSGYKCGRCSEVTNIFGSNGVHYLAEMYGQKFIGKLEIDVELPKLLDSGEIVTKYSACPSFLKYSALLDKTFQFNNATSP